MGITPQKSKKEIFCKPNENNITDKRKLWQNVKPFLSEKNKSSEKIALIKNEEIISDEAEVANSLNSYLWNVVKNFKIPGRFLTNRLFQSLSRHFKCYT